MGGIVMCERHSYGGNLPCPLCNPRDTKTYARWGGEEELKRLEDRNAVLETALAEFGHHKESCPKWRFRKTNAENHVCDCGFEALST